MKMFIGMIQQFPEQKEESPEIPEIFETMARNWRIPTPLKNGSPWFGRFFPQLRSKNTEVLWKHIALSVPNQPLLDGLINGMFCKCRSKSCKRRLSTRPWQVPRWCQVTGMGIRIRWHPPWKNATSHAWSFPNSHEQPSKTKGLIPNLTQKIVQLTCLGMLSVTRAKGKPEESWRVEGCYVYT